MLVRELVRCPLGVPNCTLLRTACYRGDSRECDTATRGRPAPPRTATALQGIDARASGSRACQTDDNGVFANHFHHDNVCVLSSDSTYSFSGCAAATLNTTVYRTWNNTLYTPDGGFGACGIGSFAAWQAAGQDTGSSLRGGAPSVAELVRLGIHVLDTGSPI
jgi:hypothetical protein